MIDANVGIALALPLPYSAAVRSRFEGWIRQGTELLAPALWGYEVTSALRKAVKAGDLEPEEAPAALARILALGVQQIASSSELHLRALDWAARLQATVAYDAAYLALAESRGVELWTADGPLFRAARARHLGWIKNVSTS